MSADAVSWVLNSDTTKGVRRLILIAIADHADKYGRNAWPSVATIARYANVSERTVQREIQGMDAEGIIVVHRGQGGTARTRSDRRPNLYEIVGMVDNGVTSDGTPLPENGVTNPLDGVTNPLDGVTPAVTRTSLERPTETKTTSSSSRRSTSERGTRLPADFEATPEMIQWAREHCPDVDRSDHEAFCDYWRAIPGAKGRKVDWIATWRNWMRSEQRRRSVTRERRTSTTDQRVNDAAALAAKYEAEDAAALASHPHLLAIGS